MGSGSNLLTDTAIKAAKTRGRLRDGNGLWLNVSKAGGKSWVYRWANGGKAREIGLGAYPSVTLSKARNLASECRAMIADGRDPKTERKKADEPTFSECVELFLADIESEWRNPKHRAQWRMTLGPAYCSKILNFKVSQISRNDVLAVLREPWKERPETASRLRGRIERVLAFATFKGWREGDNPAAWRGNLEVALPKRDKTKQGHFKALPYADAPAFVETLKSRPADAARALELLIYTVARTRNIIEMEWEHIDFQRRIWTIPAETTKTSKEYVIPLSNAAMDVLEALQEGKRSCFVFPGQKRGKGVQPDKPISNMSMEMLLRRMNVTNATPHGFRSTFRDWAGDQTGFGREAIEFCLAHSVGNKTEQAYRRSSAVEKRRIILKAWGDYCNSITDNKVIKLHG